MMCENTKKISIFRLLPLLILFIFIKFSGTAWATSYSLSINSPAAVAEGDAGTKTIVFTVTITPEIDNAASVVHVDWGTAFGSAKNGSDYTSASGSLTFDDSTGDTQTISISINGDTTVEEDESFSVILSNASIVTTNGSTVGISSGVGTGTIENDDTFTVSIESGPKSVLEGNSASFSVNLDNPVAWDVSVDYLVTGSGAHPAIPADFSSASSITIPAGSTSGIITVDLTQDDVVEYDEGFSVVLQNISPSTSGSIDAGADEGEGIIQNDDSYTVSIEPASQTSDEGSDVTYTVSIDKKVDWDIDISYTVAGTGAFSAEASDFNPASGSVTIVSGSTSNTITVSFVEDNTVEADETLAVTLNSVSPVTSGAIGASNSAQGVIQNNDIPSLSIDDVTINEGTGGSVSATFSITTDKEIASDATVAVDYAVEHLTTNDADFSGVISGTFNLSDVPAGGTETLDIPINTDSIVEADETYNLKLTNPVIIGSSTTPTILDGVGSGKIINDDIPSLSIGDVSLSEGDSGTTLMSFTVTSSLSVASNAYVTFDYSVTNNEAENDDFSGSTSGSQTISDGDSAEVVIGIAGDKEVETDETFKVKISNPTMPGSGAPVLTDDTADGTIVNDDSYIINVNVSPSTVLEDEGPVTFTISLDHPVAWPVDVTYAFNNAGTDTALSGSDFIDPATSPIHFATGETSKTVTVNLINDDVKEADEIFTLTVTAFNPATSGSIGTASSSVTIANDDHEISMNADEHGKISTTIGGVTTTVINGTDKVVVDHDATPKLDFAAIDTCYHISDILVDGVSHGHVSDYGNPNDYTTDSFTFDPVTADHNVELSTAINTYTVTTTVLGTHGTVTASSPSPYSCNPAAGPTFTATAESDYHITWFKVDGVEQPGASGQETFSYTFPNIQSDHTIEVAFTHHINIIEDSPFGSVSPDGYQAAGRDRWVEVDYGGDQAFVVSANATCTVGDHVGTHNGKKHHISLIKVDGSSVSGIQGQELSSYTLNLTNVTSDHTVEIFFASYVDVTVHANGKVVASGAGGDTTVGSNSSDSVDLDVGVDTSLKNIPNEGYHISKLLVDNAEIGLPETYVFSNVLDKDHTYEVWFDIDTFILEPVSQFGTIYETSAQTQSATQRVVNWHSDSAFYVDLNDSDHAVVGILVDNVAYDIPASGSSVTYDDFVLTNVGDDYLEVKFTDVETNHRLEAMDYDKTPISDIPLDAKLRPKPASIMFVLDDSGSMDWEFIVSGDGLYNGRYYVYSYPSVDEARVYWNNSIEAYGEQSDWRSQYFAINKMFYNPTVEYTPWPTFVGTPSSNLPLPDSSVAGQEDGLAHANIYRPRYNPWHSQDCIYAINKALGQTPDSLSSCDDSETFNMDDIFISIGGSGTDDHGNEMSSATPVAPGNSYAGDLEYSGDHDYFRIDLTSLGDLVVRIENTSDCTDTALRILDGSGNEYRTNDYDDTNQYIYYTSGNTYADDCGWSAYCDGSCGRDRAPYVSLHNVTPGTYYIDVRGYGSSTGSYTLTISFTGTSTTPPAPSPSGVSDIINAHYITWNDTDNDGQVNFSDSNDNGQIDIDETINDEIWLVNLTNPIEYYRVLDNSKAIAADNLQRVNASDVPSTVRTYASPSDANATKTWRLERQNWADWFSYYRKRIYAATAAVAQVISKMSEVEIGFRTINYRYGGYESGGYGFSQPLLPVKVVGKEDKTNRLLQILYGFQIDSYGTPLRNGLKYVGQYYDDTDGIEPTGLGESPFHAREDGDECKQVFAIAMTDGYWNGSSPGVGNVDRDYGEPYADYCSDTLADVAMKYFAHDLSTLDDLVPDGINNHQHMVTYTVAFGVHGALDPDDYDFNTGEYPDWSCPTSDQKKVDDLWHAAVNGHGKFMSASRPDQLVASLLEIMNDIGSRIGSGASVSVNGDELYESINGQVRMFQTTYNSGDWHGDLQAYQIDTSTGEVRTNDPVWSAEEKLAARLGTDGSGHGTRIIVFHDDDNTTAPGQPFRADKLSEIQRMNLTPYFAPTRSYEDVVNYLRGDKSAEGDFRTRDAAHPLGDFIHSLARFDNGVLYVGGNDGMLHAFYAGDDEDINNNGVLDPGEDLNGNGLLDNYAGEELFAYVPGLVFYNLRQLAYPLYDHKFFVDNTPYTHTMGSHTYLVGGLGKGGKGYYCLDITGVVNNGIPTISSEVDVAQRVKWEYPPPPPRLLSGSTFSFSSGSGTNGNDRITDSAKGFTADKFKDGDYIAIIGANYISSTNPATNDGIYEIEKVADDGSYIELPPNSLMDGVGNGKSIIFTKSISDQDMGYSFSRPVIVQSHDTSINHGTDFEGYVVIFGNGYASENGEAVLYILNPVTGDVIKKIKTGAKPFNGMSTPKAVDVDFDMKVDYVFAGDLLGNMWKFDLTSTDSDDWQVAYCDNADPDDHCKDTVAGMIPRPLFSGVSAGGSVRQAITAAPDVMYHSSGQGYMVIFGTGKYLGIEDLASKYTQSLYGIWDWAPDNLDSGYNGARVDDEVHPDQNGFPLITLSNWPETDTNGTSTHTLLRQIIWSEGEISEDVDQDGHLDVDEDANNNGVLDSGEDLDGDGHLDIDEDVNENNQIDVYTYYRIPSNYKGDWSLEATKDLAADHRFYNQDINGDGEVNDDDRVPVANVGWCFDLTGIIDLDGDGIDNDEDGTIDETGERILGERVVNDAIIRDGKAILISFGVTGTRCNAGGYSFVNERDADTGGMLVNPAFDLDGDGEVDEKDMVRLNAPGGGGGYIPGIPSDKAYEGRLFNPSILRKPPVNGSKPVEMKYFSTSGGGIGTMTESAETRGIYYWKQVQ